jgi:tyrosinase
MRLSRLPLEALLTFAHVAATLPLSPNPDGLPSASIERRQNAFQVVTGIQTFGVQPRLEIRQLQQNVDQWNIYLLGMAKFQATNQSDKLSYYQIAGQ